MGSSTKKPKMETKMEEELVVDILRQLPVKSLLRFKCVSVEWNSLITQPGFKNKHLNHAKNHKSFHKMLIQVQKKNSKYRGKCSFYSCSLSLPRIFDDIEILPCVSGFYSILCCYDGLVLIKHQLSTKVYSLLLWNPSTREKIQLPRVKYLNYSMYGLAYDETSDDYKVFKIASRDDETPYEILALKSGSWREIDCYNRYGPNASFGLAVVQGAFHWINCYCQDIMMFDISNEVYGEVPVPEEMVWPFQKTYRGVTTLAGMLCIHCVGTENRSNSFHLWVMKEYGVKESWTKLFTTGPSIFQPYHAFFPKYLFEDGEVLLVAKIKWEKTVFRTCNGPDEINNLIWPTQDDIDNGYVYTESLISPRVNH